MILVVQASLGQLDARDHHTLAGRNVGIAALPLEDDRLVELNHRVIDELRLPRQARILCGPHLHDAPGAGGSLELRRFDGRTVVVPGFEFENTDMDGDGPESLQAFLHACQGRPYFAGADATVGRGTVQLYRVCMYHIDR